MHKELKRCEKIETGLKKQFSPFGADDSEMRKTLDNLNMERTELTIKKSIYEVAQWREDKAIG
jgi:hypothetical protein